MEIKTVDMAGNEKIDTFLRASTFTASFHKMNKKLKDKELVKITVKYGGYSFTISSGKNGTITLNGTIPKDLLPMEGHGSLSLTESGMMAMDFEVPKDWLYGDEK